MIESMNEVLEFLEEAEEAFLMIPDDMDELVRIIEDGSIVETMVSVRDLLENRLIESDITFMWEEDV